MSSNEFSVSASEFDGVLSERYKVPLSSSEFKRDLNDVLSDFIEGLQVNNECWMSSSEFKRAIQESSPPPPTFLSALADIMDIFLIDPLLDASLLESN